MEQRVLVTGGAIRLGAVIVKALHAEGYNVIIHYHTSEEAAKALFTALNHQRKGSADLLQGDLTCKRVIRHLATQAMEGGLYGLVNNAALFIADAIPAKAKILMACNAYAPFLLSKAVAPALREQAGAIVNIGDIHGNKPLKGYNHYSKSKATLLQINQRLALSLAPAIRVNAVSPGPTLPPTKDNALTPAQQQALVQKTLLKRFTQPEDIAQAVLFCLKNHSMTGQNLILDGGRTLNQSSAILKGIF